MESPKPRSGGNSNRYDAMIVSVDICCIPECAVTLSTNFIHDTTHIYNDYRGTRIR